MKIYEYFSYKTFFYFIKGDFNIDFNNYKEQEWEDDEGLPKRVYTRYDLENAFENRFDDFGDITVIKTNFGTFLYYGENNHENIKDFMKKISKKNPCAFFGSYRTTSVYTFGLAENGEVKRYFYSDESIDFNEGEPSDFEKERPFTYLTNPKDVDYKYINEEYIFEYAKWFAGFDIENQDVKILDMKTYYPCEFNGILTTNAEEKLTRNLISSGIDAIGIFISYNKYNKKVIISASNNVDINNSHIIFFDEISYLHNFDEIFISFKRCIQAISNLNLNESHKTISYHHNNHIISPDKYTNASMILIDTEKKFMIGASKFIKKGKRVPTGKLYLPNVNLFYNLSEETLKKVLTKALKIIK